MSSLKRFVSVALAACIVTSGLAIGFAAFVKHVGSNDFKSSLTAMYREYDNGITVEDLERDKFAFSRLIVSNYVGNDYGAVDVAVDNDNNLAVLQFDSPDKAKKAYNQMQNNGCYAYADGFVSLGEYAVGEMNPQDAQILGTTQFSNDFKMKKDDVIVAVIDSGFMLDHPDLEGRFYNRGYDFSSDENEDASYEVYRKTTYQHGTFVAGIIANNTAPNVKILPYKVFDKSMLALSSGVIASMYDAIDRNVDVINMSILDDSCEKLYRNAVEKAVEKNICVVACAGNSSEDCSTTYPAAVKDVITVSAMNEARDGFAEFSNFGEAVDFCAPGTKIKSTIPVVAEDLYAYKKGTSFSTPYISAQCADIKSINKNLTKQQVYDILRDFSVDYGEKGKDEYFGYGVPNISNMVFTDNESYSFTLPKGELNIFATRDYNEGNQPWHSFAEKMLSVCVDSSVKEIGAYAFYSMSSADFDIGEVNSVGDYAFYGCRGLLNFSFGSNVNHIGRSAFGNMDSEFKILGYRNTPAESYCISEGISFEAVGCKHNYSVDIVKPENNKDGYSIYTCLVCGNSYIGDYFEPEIIAEGKCGDDVSFIVNNIGILEIYGNGEMYSYFNEASPFEKYKDSINKIYISENVSYVSPFALSVCNHIISVKSTSSKISVIDNSIYDSGQQRLIMAIGDDYDMPNSVVSFNPSAFLSVKGSINFNDSFKIENNLVYDLSGNIIMALSDYNSRVLSINNIELIGDYAFILTEYPISIRAYSDILDVGEYSFGYSYDGKVKRNSLSFYGNETTQAYSYAVDNGFYASALNTGKCGDDLIWCFNDEKNELSITGNGEMYHYSYEDIIPWYDYMSGIESIVIGDSVKSLSDYSFYSAISVKHITLPLSINAPHSNTVWNGCKTAKSVALTYGTGVMDDYVNLTSELLYTYTPWYLCRESLESFSIDPNVKYIGSYAFANCRLTDDIVLNNCDRMGRQPFYNCTGISSITNYSKLTAFAEDSFAGLSSDIVVRGYTDSTTKDYAMQYDITFSSLGCEHSRGFEANGVKAVCCYDSSVEYFCVDCAQAIYGEFIQALGNGHYVKATVKNKKNAPIIDAEVYLDGELSAITNNRGKFVIDCVKCDKLHLLEIKKHGKILASVEVDTNGNNRYGDLQIQYGDFIEDGVVNAKDYAFAKHNGFNDFAEFDYGRVINEDTEIDTAYSVQVVPYFRQAYCEPYESSDYKQYFFAEIRFGWEYIIKDCGVVYGKNMPDEIMSIENVGLVNQDGYKLKLMKFPDLNAPKKALIYGSSSKDGVVSARFYVIYSNGVKDYIAYSDVISYRYGV